MRKAQAAVFAFAMCAVMAVSSSAATAFAKTKEYPENKFSDVKNESWYAGEVKSAYEFGFMDGVSEKSFSPAGNVSVSQAVTLASRLNAAYNNATIPETGSANWYDAYVNYAKQNGIISENEFDSFDRSVTRGETAKLLACALPEDWYGAVNDIKSVPDVVKEYDKYDAVMLLYRAGVLCGNDEYGFFRPDDGLTRAEAAAVLNRTANPGERKKVTVKPVREAFYLIDDMTMTQTVRNIEYLRSGWNYENRFDSGVNVSNKTTATLADSSDKGYVSINRAFEAQNSGTLTFETSVALAGAKNGARVYFENSDGKNVLELYTKDGEFHIKGKSDVNTGLAVKNTTYFFKLCIDLDTNEGIFSCDGAKICTFSLSDDYADMSKLYYSTTKENILVMTPKLCRIYMNYPVNEGFASGKLPFDVETDTAAVASLNQPGDVYSLKLEENGYVKKSFDKIDGKAVFECYVLKQDQNAKLRILLGADDKTLLEVKLENGKVLSGSAQRAHKANIWQCIHVETDPANRKAQIFVNGKSVGSVSTEGTSFDNIRFEYEKNGAQTSLYIDDIKVYRAYDYPDYCPKPEKAESSDYTLIMSVCSIWREGTHYGWDFVSPFEENSPLLGYYDEGIPETADWEIKQMTEHGMDAIQYCWFAGVPSTFDWSENAYSVPMKRPQLYNALHDGYFYAKYSDMIDFCILWENGAFKYEWTGGKTMSLDSFKNWLWDYWVDYYFTDPRYLVIDNKPVLEIYSRDNFLTLFGGKDKDEQQKKAAEVIKFMHDDIKNYGFDGIIITFSEDGLDSDIVKTMKNIGADGFINYGYGKQSYDPEWLNDVYTRAIDNTRCDDEDYDGFAFVPTVAVGYNIVSWEGTRTPLSTVDEHKQTLEYAKRALSRNYNKSEKWAREVIYFSTWNEFGEGHWLAPSGLNGFGYADAWRSAFTNAPDEHTDVLPTANQSARITHLYNDTRTSIRSWGQEPENPADRPSEVVFKITGEDMSKPGWFFYKVDDKNFDGGVLHGKSNAADPCIFSPQDTDLDIDTSRVAMIHIRMRSPDGADSGQIYFVNDDDVFDRTAFNPWVDKYSVFFSVPKSENGEYSDIYVDMTNTRYLKYWTGKIHRLRFDPLDMADREFDVEYIEFLGYSSAQKSVGIDVDSYRLSIPTSHIERTENEMYVVADPSTGVFSANNFYHEYNRFTGRLYIKTGTDTEFVFNDGSDTVLVNGQELKLERKITLFDHVPVLPLRFILDKSGINYALDDSGLHIKIRPEKAEVYDENANKDSYEFDTDGDISGWTPYNAQVFVSDGAMTIYPSETGGSNGYDPYIMKNSLKIPAAKYLSAQVRIKCDFGVNIKGETRTAFVLYFATDTDSRLDEVKTYRVDALESETNGKDTYILNFDLASNEKWSGTVKTLRFDPPENNGTYSIDYIRFVQNPDWKEEDENSNTITKPQTPAADLSNVIGTEPHEKVDSVPNDDSYEFDKKSLSGFGILNADYEFDDNNLILKAKPASYAKSGYDVGILKSGLEIDSSAYKYVTVRVKCEFAANTDASYAPTVSKIYFTTDSDDKRNETKTLKCDIKNAYDDGGGYYVFVYETSACEEWKGKITSVLYDPTDNNGTYTIDYIRFVK